MAVITRKNASRALIYLVVSLLAVAVIFFMLGAPFAAALEVVVYAGAIVVLFLFVVMMLNLGKTSVMRETRWLQPGMWIGPFILVAILAVAFAYAFAKVDGVETKGRHGRTRCGRCRLVRSRGRICLAVELAGFLLLAALVGAYHLGRRYLEERREED